MFGNTTIMDPIEPFKSGKPLVHIYLPSHEFRIKSRSSSNLKSHWGGKKNLTSYHILNLPTHLREHIFDHININISNFNRLVISCLGVTSAQAQQIRRIHGTIRLACADQKVCLGHRWLGTLPETNISRSLKNEPPWEKVISLFKNKKHHLLGAMLVLGSVSGCLKSPSLKSNAFSHTDTGLHPGILTDWTFFWEPWIILQLLGQTTFELHYL